MCSVWLEVVTTCYHEVIVSTGEAQMKLTVACAWEPKSLEERKARCCSFSRAIDASSSI